MQFMLMVRLIQFFMVILCGSFIFGCSNQFVALTEQVNVIELDDFVDETLTIETINVEENGEESIEVFSSETSDNNEPKETVVIAENELEVVETREDLFQPKSIGIPITVEALVGQVNGRPIYANEVLEPVSDQLAAVSKTVSRSQFADQVSEMLFHEHESMGTSIRGGRLFEMVITDLLLSEAYGNLSKEETYGIFSIISQLRGDLTSVQGGSSTKMRLDIQHETGLSVDEFLEFQRDKILIDILYRQKIWPKVNVTWRDIQREFKQIVIEHSFDLQKEISPERIEKILIALQMGTSLANIPETRGQLSLGMIRVPNESPLLEEITAAFESGVSFAEIALMVGDDKGGFWQTFEMGRAGIQDIDASDFITKQLEGAHEGDLIEQFPLGNSQVWLKVLEVQQPILIYNKKVQIALNNALQWVQFNREKYRFVESLWGEGSIEEVQTMADRVKNIAVRRHFQ